ncbi:MAG: zinc-binding dehydrogenase [Candidatus Heimdallarchaeota archaeon]|nr:zinc-binding dehydrogenase [Candidatus Heimdallarchaeota archaeon]
MIKYSAMQQDGSVDIVKTEEPVLEEGAILLDTLYSEVCGTDVHLMHGQLAGVPYPIIPGHVSTGVIDKINGEVTDIDGILLKVGDAVTFLDVHETCNACWYCLVAKETTRCPSRKVYGITYSATEGLLGGWSQKIYLKPGVKVIRLPSKEFARKFIAAGCGLPTAIHGVERANIKLGNSVIVQGSGPVGLMAAILSKLSGAFEVILIGGPELRLKIAKSFGIEKTLNIFELSAEERKQKVMEWTNNRGVDIIIEATGVPSAINEGFELIRDGGTYVIVGQYTDAGEISINPHLDINKKHLTIKGSWGSDFSHFYLAVKFVEKYQDLPWEKVISKDYSLDEVAQALQDLKAYKIMKAVIKPN